jgi:DNA-binding transcriptional MerR regulator
MNIDGKLSIGAMADAAGVKVVTVRYYEKVKLMPEPPRSDGNYRAYKREHLHRLRFIRRCRELGFTLAQVRELLRLSVQGKQGCSDVDRMASKHLDDIERKIGDLKRLAAELRGINRQCPGNRTIDGCRILEALLQGNAQ